MADPFPCKNLFWFLAPGLRWHNPDETILQMNKYTNVLIANVPMANVPLANVPMVNVATENVLMENLVEHNVCLKKTQHF